MDCPTGVFSGRRRGVGATIDIGTGAADTPDVRATGGVVLTDREDLVNLGFEGFVSVRNLRASRLSEVPACPGVYVFVRVSEIPPTFLTTSPGGRFKSKDPTVPIEVLTRRWVPGTTIVYIGKAGGLRKPPTIRKRLQQYLDFGAGKPVGHWGGRFIWQLTDAEELVVCWRPVEDADPESIESAMLAAFDQKHASLPFANLKRGASAPTL